MVAAAGLSPRLIEALQDRFSPEFRTDFGETDGTKIPTKQWFNQDKSMLPLPLTEDDKEAARKRVEEIRSCIRRKWMS